MAGDERVTIDLGKADFDEIYRGAATIAGEPIRTPPWDIGEPQPELVRLVRGGELYRVDAPEADAIEDGDRLLYVKKVTPAEP